MSRGKSSKGYRATGDIKIQSARIPIRSPRNRREQNLRTYEYIWLLQDDSNGSYVSCLDKQVFFNQIFTKF